MGRAYRGPYARVSSYEPAYATAAKWGTGIDAIHSYYGEGPPLRVMGRTGAIGSSPVGGSSQDPGMRDYQTPGESSGGDPPEELTWGYPVDYTPDSVGMGADGPISYGDTAPGEIQYMDDRPHWGEETATERLRRNTGDHPSWNRPGTFFRAIREGSHRYRTFPSQPNSAYAPISAEAVDSQPTETVSEGWLNKVTSFVADANPSADEQIFVQTSMRQRYLSKDNGRAQARATDEARSTISSRVAAMVEKVYSEGERNYDMFPYQSDQINRPFRFRTAGTGRADWMLANAYSQVTPVQRTPPADPAAGIPEVQDAGQQYGYTGEDSMYYG
jgi:hypothetical protein